MAGLSGVVVSQLGTGEQLLLWALRQRRADRGATSPILAHGFRLACGLAGVESALERMNAQAGHWFGAMQQLAAGMAGRDAAPTDIVQGWRQARPEERQAIAAALNATVDDLFGDASQQAHA